MKIRKVVVVVMVVVIPIDLPHHGLRELMVELLCFQSKENKCPRQTSPVVEEEGEFWAAVQDFSLLSQSFSFGTLYMILHFCLRKL